MRVAILETVKTNGGFEQEFDRLIINELKMENHEPVLLLPENSTLPVDFGIPVEYVAGGTIVDYEGAGKIKKTWLSLQREIRRVKWFDSAMEKAVNGEFDAIILTTATYRYLRSLHKSSLKESPIPIIFIFLGINPKEKPKFVAQARKCLPYKNIKLKITSLRNDFLDDNLPNVEIIKPPVLMPPGVSIQTALHYHKPIRIGFFGHYRKGEKDINDIIGAFVKSGMSHMAELVVQVAPTEQEDAADLRGIMDKYEGQQGVTFIKGKLQGKQWYDTLQCMDVLLLPYSNPRYLYNWSAVYFNAIGMHKPVLTTKLLNPEILQTYDIGVELNLQDLDHMADQMRAFLNSYDKNIEKYGQELNRLNQAYSVEYFLQAVLK